MLIAMKSVLISSYTMQCHAVEVDLDVLVKDSTVTVLLNCSSNICDTLYMVELTVHPEIKMVSNQQYPCSSSKGRVQGPMFTGLQCDTGYTITAVLDGCTFSTRSFNTGPCSGNHGNNCSLPIIDNQCCLVPRSVLISIPVIIFVVVVVVVVVVISKKKNCQNCTRLSTSIIGVCITVIKLV